MAAVYLALSKDSSPEATLWGTGAWANTIDWGGADTIITGTVNIWDAPAFVDLVEGDYHISSGSAARDAGVDAGVTTDIDGDPRPQVLPLTSAPTSSGLRLRLLVIYTSPLCLRATPPDQAPLYHVNQSTTSLTEKSPLVASHEEKGARFIGWISPNAYPWLSNSGRNL